jgi:group I intron endonuclease
MIGIYKILNKLNNKCYIGKSEKDIEKRWKSHLTLLNNNKHYNPHLQYAFNKNYEVFEFSIVEICSVEDCNEREIYWIKEYNSCNHKYGYNLTYGGEGGLMCAESLEKMMKSSIGRKHTQETKDKISKAHEGLRHTEEAKKKMSLSSIGKPTWNKGKTGIYSEETLRKISIGSTKNQRENPITGDKHYRYMKFTDEQLLEMLKLKNDGLTYRKIALKFNISPGTVRNRIIELKNKREEEIICKEGEAI